MVSLAVGEAAAADRRAAARIQAANDLAPAVLLSAQRYGGLANHPLFRVSRVAVKGGKALSVLAVAGGPAGVAVAGAAIVAAVGAGWSPSGVGDDVGAAIHDDVIAPVDRTLDRTGSAVKGTWERIFG